MQGPTVIASALRGNKSGNTMGNAPAWPQRRVVVTVGR
jgi:hypothetical protein